MRSLTTRCGPRRHRRLPQDTEGEAGRQTWTHVSQERGDGETLLLAVLADVPSQPQPRGLLLTASCPPHSKLRPALNLEKKSRLLTVCLRSVLALPLLDVLEKHTSLFLEQPNIQVRPHPPPLPGPG